MHKTLFFILVLVAGFSAQACADAWAYQNSPETVAKALHVGPSLVKAAGQEGFAPELCWMVAKMADHCGCGVAGVLQYRETKSWGEVAKACGLDWVELNDQISQLQRSGALVFEEANPAQLSLSGANHAQARSRIKKAVAERAARQEARP
jgi:hypothetical protein